MGVACRDDCRALLQECAVAGSKLGGEFGGDFNIGDARDADSTEQRCLCFRPPYQRFDDLAAGFDNLLWPELYISADMGAVAQLALVTNDCAFLNPNIILNHHAATNRAGTHFCAGADVAAIPHNGLFDLRTFGNNDIVAEDGVGSDDSTA